MASVYTKYSRDLDNVRSCAVKLSAALDVSPDELK